MSVGKVCNMWLMFALALAEAPEHYYHEFKRMFKKTSNPDICDKTVV